MTCRTGENLYRKGDTDYRRGDKNSMRGDTYYRRGDTDLYSGGGDLNCRSRETDCRREDPDCGRGNENCVQIVTSSHSHLQACAQATRVAGLEIFCSLGPCASQQIVFYPNGDAVLIDTMDTTLKDIVDGEEGATEDVIDGAERREVDNGAESTTKDDVDGLERTTVIRVEPLDGEASLFCVRLTTEHYAFSLKNSCTLRRVGEFYQLESVLKWVHPYVAVPSMPLRPFLWLSGQQTKLKQLVTFLSLVLKQRQLLSNKALHLFLQTQLSMDEILENISGQRDDQVVQMEKARSSEGFKELFGEDTVVEMERKVQGTVWK